MHGIDIVTIEPERFNPARVSALLDATMALISPPSTQRAENKGA